ncbi:class I adenylate-forming enzyme family protein [Actinophytocola glycyrrhizae]|uniref:Class I adenylate-forming enzyme family protein n=1 Tax=Actinophytocola glycyrrhizae TaxID=2044873 RepID=A0ABV9S6L8_9PSEU
MIAELLFDAAERFGDRVAVADRDERLTYRQLADRVRETGIPGAPYRVGLMAENSVAYVCAYFSVLRSGAIPFLIDYNFGPRELGVIAVDCGLDVVVHDGRDVTGEARGTVGGLRVTALTPPQDAPRPLPDTAVCRFTSGSTGKPNCIEFSGDAVVSAARNWANGTGLTADDRIACFAALSNGLAFNTSLLAAFLTGAALHLDRGLPTGGRLARTLRDVGATRLVGFPALYESLLRRPDPRPAVGGLRVAISSGAPLDDESGARFARLTGVPISNYYGVAEAGPLTFPTGDVTGGLGSPLPGVRLVAGTAGASAEIRVRSESMGSRYLNAPGMFEARLDDQGYYRTGDEGFLTDGALYLSGRTDRMINVAGRKVDPIEVAGVLGQADGVRECVVFEAAGQHGEPVVAAVVVGDGLDLGALRLRCSAELAGYKVPGFLLAVREIPRNGIGKPALPALRRLVEQQAVTT